MTNILTNSAALKSLYHLQRNEGRATEATEDWHLVKGLIKLEMICRSCDRK